MQGNQKPRPIAEYQTRQSGAPMEDGKYRGVIACTFDDGSGSEVEYFYFTCAELRDTKAEAMADVATLFYVLEDTPSPTVAINGCVYSLPWDKEKARAEKWLNENDHITTEFEKEFPGARLITDRPLGGSTFRT